MNEDFRNEYIEVKNRALLKANAYYFSHMEEITAIFQEALRGACKGAARLQAEGCPQTEYMEVTMLRTRLTDHDYRIPILIYGTDWYADPAQAQAGTADGRGIFSFYEDMIQETKSLVKKYRMKLPERMLAECMCAAAGDFWGYVELACQRAVMGFTPTGMAFTDAFRVRVCEYMGYGQVCRRYTPEMGREALRKWFGEREEEAYQFRDYRGFDFTGWDFRGLDLSGCDFRDCKLDGCNFEEAVLEGAWFCNSSMKKACLKGAWVTAARFDGADLENADLVGAHSVSKINGELWLRPDNERVSFMGCRMRQADCRFSAMEEADFGGADLEETVFNEEHKAYYRLDGRQSGQIRSCGF